MGVSQCMLPLDKSTHECGNVVGVVSVFIKMFRGVTIQPIHVH